MFEWYVTSAKLGLRWDDVHGKRLKLLQLLENETQWMSRGLYTYWTFIEHFLKLQKMAYR